MRELSVRQIEDAVCELFQTANRKLPCDLAARIADAAQAETEALPRAVMEDIAANLTAADEMHVPICQDTGMAVLFCDLGQDVHLVGGDFTEAVNRGVARAYRDGYQPTIENEIVTIILPLQSTDRLLDDKITVTLDLSATGTTFVIANYQKTVVLSEQNINGTEETREIFYVDFSIPLSSSRVNGSYPVRLQVKAYDLNYTPIEAVFTVYVNITDVPPKPTSTGGGAETPTAEPVVLIAHSDITPENVMAGEAFTVKLTLRNSLDTKLVRNMLLRVDTGNLQINLAEDSPVLQLESGRDVQKV